MFHIFKQEREQKEHKLLYDCIFTLCFDFNHEKMMDLEKLCKYTKSGTHVLCNSKNSLYFAPQLPTHSFKDNLVQICVWNFAAERIIAMSEPFPFPQSPSCEWYQKIGLVSKTYVELSKGNFDVKYSWNAQNGIQVAYIRFNII